MNFQSEKLVAPIAKRIACIVVAICGVLVILNVAASAYFNPNAVVSRELNALAEEYYEDYLYQNLIGDRTGDAIAEELKHYEKTGVSTTYLRQLLLYDSGRRNAAAGYFEQDNYSCDPNRTYVKYYPEPPYGPKDYHFSTKLVCE